MKLFNYHSLLIIYEFVHFRYTLVFFVIQAQSLGLRGSVG